MPCHIPIRLSDDYISKYNLRAKEKSVKIGQKVLVLTPGSTSLKTFSRRVGPAVIKDKVSNHSYLVDINGAVKHIHADKLRKYHIQVNRSFVTQSQQAMSKLE